MNKHGLIRIIYIYLFSALGLIFVMMGSVQLVTLFLKIYVFTEADRYYDYPMRPVPAPVTSEKVTEIQQPDPADLEAIHKKQQRSQRQRDAAGAVAMLIVGLPLYLYHWKVVQRDKNNNA